MLPFPTIKRKITLTKVTHNKKILPSNNSDSTLYGIIPVLTAEFRSIIMLVLLIV
jgi:hypothetical protein